MRQSLRQRAVTFPSDRTLPKIEGGRSRLTWLAYLGVKRVLDVVLSVIGLIVLFPVLVAVALAIFIDSGLPIIFAQDRVGKNGKTIRIYKFRTMHSFAPSYSLKVGLDSPRVTRLGRFLRRRCIDELPQLVNVIKGEMSLVGPRPEQPWIVSHLYQPWQYRRLRVTPGLTGWWQVNDSRCKPMHENTELDLHYIENRSLWMDLRILSRTLVVVFGKDGIDGSA